MADFGGGRVLTVRETATVDGHDGRRRRRSTGTTAADADGR